MGYLLMKWKRVHPIPPGTGVMCLHGMDVSNQSSKMKQLNILCVQWDPCCGPLSEIMNCESISFKFSKLFIDGNCNDDLAVNFSIFHCYTQVILPRTMVPSAS